MCYEKYMFRYYWLCMHMLLAGPISHTSTQYMDFVEIFNIVLDLSAIYFSYSVGVELPLCIVVTLS